MKLMFSFCCGSVVTVWLLLVPSDAQALTPGAPDRTFRSSLDSSGEGVRWATRLPGGRVLVGGAFTSMQGVRRDGLARLLPNGRLDLSFDPGLGFRGVTGADAFCFAKQADGKILVAGTFETYHLTPVGGLVRLLPDLSLDPAFRITSGANGPIYSVVTDAEGRIWVGGSFTEFHGLPRGGVARLLPNGEVDPSFAPASGVSGGAVWTIFTLPSGGAYLGGTFTSFNGVARGRIARVLTGGALDGGFVPPAGGVASGMVRAMALDSSGNLLVGGFFEQYAGVNRRNLIRLNSSAALDASYAPAPGTAVISIVPRGEECLIAGSFNMVGSVAKGGLARINAQGVLVSSFAPGAGASGVVSHLEVEPSGTMLVAGDFSQWGSSLRNCVARLSASGRLLGRFVPRGRSTVTQVACLAVQPNGRILVGGYFDSHGNRQREGITRLLRDGGRDPSFNVGRGVRGSVNALALQADGRILIVGSFDQVNGVPMPGVARLLSNGRLDRSFDPGSGFSGPVFSILATPAGEIYVGGGFTSYRGVTANGLVRLLPNGERDGTFTQGLGVQSGREIYAMALQPNGRLLIGGSFEAYNGVAVPYITRLLSTGAVDGSFVPGTGANNYVRVIRYTRDNQILVGGSFSQFNGATRMGVVRLGVNGAVDVGFNSAAALLASATVNDIVEQADGRVIVVGGFTASGADYNLARLNQNGSRDTSFRTGEGVLQYDEIVTAGLQADGKLIIGGEALSFDAIPQVAVCRVHTAYGTAQATFTGAVVPPNDQPATAGQIRLTLTRNRFSAVLRQVGVRTSFRGTMDEQGEWSDTITRSDGVSLMVTLNVVRDPLGQGGHRLGGSVQQGSSIGAVSAYPVFFNARLAPFSHLAGYYTLRVFQSNTANLDLPHGHGFYSLRQRTRGAARMVGRLSDDSPFTASVNLSPRGGMSFYAPLRGGRGFFCGGALIGGDPSRQTGGASVRWYRAAGGSGAYSAGFYLTVSVFGSVYTPPAGAILGLPIASNNAKFRVSHGNLGSPNDQSLSIDARNRVLSASGLRLQIAARTGLISGSYRLNGDSPFVRLRGMAVNALNEAPGYLFLTEAGEPRRSSRIQLQPN